MNKEKNKRLLIAIEANDEIFYKVLNTYKYYVKKIDNIYDYFYGYSNKADIYYNGKDIFICQAYRLINFKEFKNIPTWKQVIVRLRFGSENTIQQSVSGSIAKAYINKLLLKYYTHNEIDKRLKMFQAEYDADLKQLHYNGDLFPFNKIIKIPNTYKFDINGAHLDALCEIFPKAKNDFIKMYEKRHDNPNFKSYPNFYVGFLAHKTAEMKKNHQLGEYELTYNWIVQRTTSILLEAINKLGGKIIYMNTDGVVVQNPENLITTSKNLGDFKLEYSGNTYFYRDKNYFIYQFGEDNTVKDALKGCCLTEVRNSINLATGDVVHYDLKQLNSVKFAKNIIKEHLEIYEEKE